VLEKIDETIVKIEDRVLEKIDETIVKREDRMLEKIDETIVRIEDKILEASDRVVLRKVVETKVAEVVAGGSHIYILITQNFDHSID
jgi:pyruvate/2-oxoglutarate dehydrogenase complex dihydrolipoamide dehydrogenase (E3) component